MKKIIFFPFICCVLKLLSCGQSGEHDAAKKVAPFKMFDNLYYVGNEQVSAYLLTSKVL